MALRIDNSTFSIAGAEIKPISVYIDVMIVFPHGKSFVEARLQAFAFENSELASGPLAIDGIHSFLFSPEVLIKTDFWSDVNAGNVHEFIITQLENERPEWRGKITKMLPL